MRSSPPMFFSLHSLLDKTPFEVDITKVYIADDNFHIVLFETYILLPGLDKDTTFIIKGLPLEYFKYISIFLGLLGKIRKPLIKPSLYKTFKTLIHIGFV